ncbi:MAG: ParB/RepB/Spo0J family partition protein [Clostridia bacterium]|nr:ParB/RepB/Spo0J family partition protein [Clostridia bacterium]MBR3975526.1 ParB/RepB/Spo0J family partition protein [Clostridia bacterium]
MKRKAVKTGARILFIPIEDIHSNPFRPRTYYCEQALNELAASIGELGIIQPLSVCDKKDGTYQLISGERRLRAAKLAGLVRVPCVLFSNEIRKAALMTVTENMQRSDLNFFEEAALIDKLSNVFCFTLGEISDILGKSELYLMNKTRLLSISLEMRKEMLENGLTEKHARAFLRLQSEADRQKLLTAVINERLTVSQTLERSREITGEKSAKPEPIKLFKDINIFVNTVEHAIDTMQKSGIDALSDKTEDENSIEYRIIIPKIG